MADPLDSFESEQAAKKQARANRRSRKQQTGETPVLKKPMFGYEQARQESIQGWGGTTIDGRKRNPKEVINEGPYRGMAPGVGLNAQRTDYAKSSPESKQAATYRAEGGDIRTPQEVAAQGEFDRQQSLAMFGPQGSEPGRGNRMGMGGRKGQSPAAPSDPANPLTRPSVASAAPIARPTGPMMTGDQFRQAQSQVAATGKSARMPVAQPSMIKPAAPVITIAAKTQGATALAAPAKPLSTRTAADIMAGGSSYSPPSLNAQEYAADPAKWKERQTAKATREVATLKSDAIAKANIAPADPTKKAAPIPDPSPAVQRAAFDFAKSEVGKLGISPLNPMGNDYKPKSFLQSPQYAAAQNAPAATVAQAGRAGKANTATPMSVAARVEKAIGKGPTEFAPLPSSGGRKGAAPRVAASPLKTPSPAKIAQR